MGFAIKTFLFFNVFFSSFLFGKTLTYTGIAKEKDKLVYTEKHTVNYDDKGRISVSETQYFDSKNELIAILKADYRLSITTPEYSFKNMKSGNLQGIRHQSNKIALFNQDSGKDEKIKELSAEDSKDRIVFGCQGLNYYFVENLPQLESNKSQTIPIKFLIPGNLDAYDFYMKIKDKSPEGILNVEIKIDNFFLRLFAPSLKVQYDTIKKRIVSYEGISNLNDENGKMRSVSIQYLYDT